MTNLSLLISAIVAILGIWADVFKGAKRQRNKHKKREMIIRVMGTILALSALSIGYIKYRDDQSKDQAKKLKAEAELRSAQKAYATLQKTYLEAIKTGKAVNNIDLVSKNLRDSLDTASLRISRFSKAQLQNLAQLHKGTEALLNSLPAHMIIGWFIRYKVSPEEVEALDEVLKGRPYDNENHPIYKLNDTLLFEIYRPWSFQQDISSLRFRLIAKNKSITYSGGLENYGLPGSAYTQDLNDAAKPFVNIIYSQSEHYIEFSGIQRLRMEDVEGSVTSLLDFATCDLLFTPSYISSNIKNIKIESVSVFAGLRNSNKFGSHHNWNYDVKSQGFMLKNQKILVENKNLYW